MIKEDGTSGVVKDYEVSFVDIDRCFGDGAPFMNDGCSGGDGGVDDVGNSGIEGDENENIVSPSSGESRCRKSCK